MPLVPRLLQENPQLRIDLLLTDTIVDIVSTGVDIAVRIGDLRDSSFISTSLGRNTRILCAAPNYLAVRGKPKRLEDLSEHDCILTTGTLHWRFTSNEKERSVRVSGRVSASNIEGVLDACLVGAGLAVLSTWHAESYIASGRLVQIKLKDAVPKEMPITAVYPTNRQILPKVKVFLAAVKQSLAARRESA
jgi:DNA-binding transcriptional LysR family regulator